VWNILSHLLHKEISISLYELFGESCELWLDPSSADWYHAVLCISGGEGLSRWASAMASTKCPSLPRSLQVVEELFNCFCLRDGALKLAPLWLEPIAGGGLLGCLSATELSACFLSVFSKGDWSWLWAWSAGVWAFDSVLFCQSGVGPLSCEIHVSE